MPGINYPDAQEDELDDMEDDKECEGGVCDIYIGTLCTKHQALKDLEDD